MSPQQARQGAGSAAAKATLPTGQALLQTAITHHRAGRLGEAETLYRRALDHDRTDINVLNLLALLTQQTGRAGQAVELFRAAIAIDHRQPALHAGLGRAHIALAQFAAGEAALRQAAARAPDSIEYRIEIANFCLTQGRADEAVQLYRDAAAAQPNHGGVHNNLGAALRDLGRHGEAIDRFHRSLALGPAPETFNNLAAALNDVGKPVEAEVAARAGLALGPGYADLHNNLGNALARRQRHDDALAAFDQALALNRDFAEAHNNRGNALKELGRIDAAIAAFQSALTLRPNYAEALGNLGAAIQAKGRLIDAEACNLAALALAPDRGSFHNNLGTAVQAQGRTDEAAGWFARAIALNPDDHDAWSNRLFAIAFLPGFDDAAQYRENRAWAARAEARAKPLPAPIFDRAVDRVLRLGYVSPDFREHVLLRAFDGVIAHHDRQQFRLFCYADVARPDAQTERLVARFDGWRNLHGQNDAERAALIRADGIDILVCISGYLARDRLLFARRIAPLQIAYANHVSTTGLSTMDCRISDPWLDPVGGTERWNSEALIRLSSGYTSFSPEPDAPAVTPLPARANGYITFGSFNNLAKLTPAAIALWAEILRELPDARLLLKAGSFSDPVIASRYRDQFAAHGIDARRLDLIGWVPSKAENNALFGQCDIALDPFPFNGGVTSQSALWIGLPIVSLAGPSFVGRLGRSVLARAGLAHLVAATPAEYRAIAVNLARDLAGLAELRAGMRARLAASPIFDHAGHTRQLEDALRAAWRRLCAATPEEKPSP